MEEDSSVMKEDSSKSPWENVLEFTKMAQEKEIDTLTWAIRVSSILSYFNTPLPCPELADVLVAHICWDNNVPVLWKFLEKAIAARIVPPMLSIALLSTRVFPIRRKKPVAYRLYMEILKRHCFDFTSQLDPSFKRILMMVDEVLHLSKRFGAQANERGVFEVEYIFCILWLLLDATLEDEGLLDLPSERNPSWVNGHDMELDITESNDESRNKYCEKLVKENTMMAIELIDQFLHHKVIYRLLFLVHQNMPSHWQSFSQCLHLLTSNSLALKNSTVSTGRLINWSFDILNKKCWQFKHSKYRDLCPISSGPFESPGGHCHGPSRSAIWVPLDLYLEDAIDGSVAATNAIETISGLLKILQAVNRTTWHEAFLGLWIASLRLVQRVKDLIEGPVPHEDARMCLLLSITTLSIADVINEDKSTINNQMENSNISQLQDTVLQGERHKALVHSLQLLGNFESLLVPPPSFISVANQAAAKALAFVSGIPVSVGFFESIGTNNKLNCSGNMWHLIVEACIARNLLDTSAYFWPGYVKDHPNQIQHKSDEGSDWSALMTGAKLTSAMMKIPASSLPELETVFEIAASSLDNDRIFAATILCSASLIRGWNIQEYTVCFIVKLLSPSVPVEYSGRDSHLISHAPVLDVVLAGISSVDCVQIFSFHGLVPELAAALMAICEVFGSCMSYTICVLPTGEEVTPHTVFSNAFILLLRLWEFNHTPLEYILMGDGAPVGSQLTPEYLLLLHNSKIMKSCNNNKNQNIHQQLLRDKCSTNLVYMDTFPKLKVWYSQHQACLASTLSGLTSGTPVCLIVDSLLSMMFRKVEKEAYQTCSVTSGGSSMNSSSNPESEATVLRPKLPAWDIMEAIPYVVDATLTACAHGKLSPRELATGLKDLADFLPASLAAIISYFSAEVTRGVWKPADMNGTDWPSPAANLSTVEENIKKIIAGTGVDVPSLGKALDSPTTLPLPLAAFVSLTITYKLDKAASRFLNLAGPALENLSASCPWPSMAIVTALWTQKVKRWSNFLTFSASRTVFHHNNYAVSQILKSCFASILGLSQTPGSECGVGNLLGHGLSCDSSGGLSPVAPGILFLRTYRSSRDVMFLTEEIISLLMLSVRQVTGSGISDEYAEKLTNSKHGVRYGHTSLISSFTQVKTAASVGATFVWLSGGCGLIQCMFREIFPSWFLTVRNSDQGHHDGMVAMLEGYVLAYFAVLCGMFAWGVDVEPTWRLRPKVVRVHLEFMADALDDKVSLGCSWETWCAYVSAFIGLVLDCAPNWLLEVDLGILTRLGHHLRHYNEEELAILLLSKSGAHAMGAAAEIIIECQ